MMCLCVCWSRSWAVLKRLNRSRCCLRCGLVGTQGTVYVLSEGPDSMRRVILLRVILGYYPRSIFSCYQLVYWSNVDWLTWPQGRTRTKVGRTRRDGVDRGWTSRASGSQSCPWSLPRTGWLSAHTHTPSVACIKHLTQRTCITLCRLCVWPCIHTLQCFWFCWVGSVFSVPSQEISWGGEDCLQNELFCIESDAKLNQPVNQKVLWK